MKTGVAMIVMVSAMMMMITFATAARSSPETNTLGDTCKRYTPISLKDPAKSKVIDCIKRAQGWSEIYCSGYVLKADGVLWIDPNFGWLHCKDCLVAAARDGNSAASCEWSLGLVSFRARYHKVGVEGVGPAQVL